MDIFLARQPILDKFNRVFGYEILFRGNDKDNQYNSIDEDEATINVMQNALVNIGIDKIVGNKKAFINFTNNTLKEDFLSFMPSENIVIEVLENIVPTIDIINVCKKLKEKRFIIALDDFVFDDKYIELISLADIIKIDFIITKGTERQYVIKKLKGINANLKFLAEKVETLEEFHEAVEMGYSYFQGYYFSKPQIIKSKKIPENKMLYLNVIKELNSKEFSFESVEKLIKKDISLSYKLLKIVNSAKYSFKSEIKSIGHAIALIGEKEIKKWLYFICLKPICGDKLEAVMIESLFRAKFSEILIKKTLLKNYFFNVYITGIMSLMDVILQKPLEEIVEEIMLPKEVKMALTGKKINYCSKMLDIAIAYERAEWQKSVSLAAHFNLSEKDIIEAYRETIRWIDEVTLGK